MVRWIDGRQTNRQAGRYTDNRLFWIKYKASPTRFSAEGSSIVVMSGCGAFERWLGPEDSDFMKVLISSIDLSLTTPSLEVTEIWGSLLLGPCLWRLLCHEMPPLASQSPGYHKVDRLCYTLLPPWWFLSPQVTVMKPVNYSLGLVKPWVKTIISLNWLTSGFIAAIEIRVDR